MTPEPKVVLDAKGLSCPLPVVKARLELDKLAPGEVLQVLATDPGSVADFDSWTKMTGHELLASEEHEGVYTYAIRKAG